MATDRDRLKFIPLDQIRENPISLRSVDKETEEYAGLVDSIKVKGIITPISVRSVADPESGQKYYSLVDGLHRFTAAQDAGLTEVPAQILTLTEVGVLEAQLMANIHKVETKPVEYAKCLQRILSHDPLLTEAGLSVKLGKSPTWVGQRLGLAKLDPKIQKIVDDGTINLTNAIAMSKLPIEEQGQFVDRAMTMSPAEFTPTVAARVKEVRDARRQGREAAPAEFVAIPHLRSLKEIKSELESPTVLPALIKELGLRKPDEIVNLALQYVLMVDPKSAEVAKNKYEARKKEEAEGKAARQAARQAARELKAAQTQAAVLSA